MELNKAERIDFRIPAEDKETIERAAMLSGQTVSSFIKQILTQASQRIIRTHQETVLSSRDAEAFLDLLDSDEIPNQALSRAAEQYRKNNHG